MTPARQSNGRLSASRYRTAPIKHSVWQAGCVAVSTALTRVAVTILFWRISGIIMSNIIAGQESRVAFYEAFQKVADYLASEIVTHRERVSR